METWELRTLDEAYGAAVMEAERRRSQRQAVVANAWLSPAAGSGGPGHHVVVGDLSLHGIGFYCDQPLELKAIYWMVLEAAVLRVSSRIRLATCRVNPGGGFICGAEFF